MAGVSAASGHNASYCVKKADRFANASKRGSRNARVVCSITLPVFCKTKQSAALELPRFQRSCSMAFTSKFTLMVPNNFLCVWSYLDKRILDRILYLVIYLKVMKMRMTLVCFFLAVRKSKLKSFSFSLFLDK
jgi:hypothetical protein